MIINSHVHLNTSNDYFFYNDYCLKRFKEEMDETGIDITLPCLNPKVSKLRCYNDCSFFCNGKVNYNLQNCSCKQPMRHRPCVTSEGGMYKLYCKTCGKIILISEVDPLRYINIELIEQTKKYRNRIKPILYLSLCEATLQKEIEFFEINYKGEYVGYKFHPWTDQVSIKNFKIETDLPILIHTGMRDLESSKNVILFSKFNKNNKIIITHAAQLKESILKQIASSENLYIDCCPAMFLYKNKQSCLEYSDDILSPEDIFYKVMKFIPSEKILFGTDSPWGNSKDELQIINNLNITKQEKDNILFRNALNIYF